MSMLYTFTEVPDARVVLVSNGVFQMTPLFVRRGFVYAKHGAGYVRLAKAGHTSKPKLKWDDVHWPDNTENPDYDKLGRMVVNH